MTAQGDGEVFAGTIWVATHGSDKIFILDPNAGTGITPDPTDRDVDHVEDTFDPFSADPTNGLANVINANETLVWEFISGAPFPNESEDLFDGASGLYNGFDIGFTGIMTDGTGLPESFLQPGKPDCRRCARCVSDQAGGGRQSFRQQLAWCLPVRRHSWRRHGRIHHHDANG